VFIFSLALLAGPMALPAEEIQASGLSPAAIQAAADVALPGDTIVLPAGTYSSFNSTVYIPVGVSLRGAGVDSTILQSGGATANFFVWNSNYQTSSSRVEISHFRCEGAGGGGGNSGSCIYLYRLYDFKAHDLDFRDFRACGFRIYEGRGVIYDCAFTDIYPADLGTTGYGVSVVGDDRWDEEAPALGTQEFIFIEDCSFNHCKHGVACNSDGRYVARYNTFQNPISNRFLVDIHGKQTSHQAGTRAFEIYGNTLIGDSSRTDDWGMGIRGGTGVIYNNTISDLADSGWPTAHKAIALTIDTVQEAYPGGYPDPFQPKDVYVWDNTLDGAAITDCRIGSTWVDWIQKDRDYFMSRKSGYAAYTYPHPLRSEEALPELILDPTQLSFTAEAGGENPAAQSFTVSFSDESDLEWSTSCEADGLVCTPSSGTGGATVSVSLDTVGMSAGTYNADIVVSASETGNTPRYVAVELTLTAPPSPLSALAEVASSSGYAPHEAAFTGTGSGGVSPYSFAWDFGDGDSDSVQNPGHVYTAAGTYTAILTVTDQMGDTDSDSIIITVAEEQQPVGVEASAGSTSGLNPLTVEFFSAPEGGTSPYTYYWDFGDASTPSTDANPSHEYVLAGTFTARVTVTDQTGQWASDTLTINVQSSSSDNDLSISAVTDGPAPGWGGSTYPEPGTHSVGNGASLGIRAAADEDYRFAKWTGDLTEEEAMEPEINLLMDRSRDVQAHFFTKCGDVNGDLQVSPSDAQMAFDIYMGLQDSFTEAQLENADANCDGTVEVPRVTPQDAQSIFNYYLKGTELPGDCSCKSRYLFQTQASDAFRASTAGLSASIDGTVRGLAVEILFPDLRVGREIEIPVVVKGSAELKAFGFDLLFPMGALEFVGYKDGRLSRKFDSFAVHPIADGVVRIGGFSSDSVSLKQRMEVVTLVFRVLSDVVDDDSVVVTNNCDDFQTADFQIPSQPEKPGWKKDSVIQY
jgi:PKD repeat protein